MIHSASLGACESIDGAQVVIGYRISSGQRLLVANQMTNGDTIWSKEFEFDQTVTAKDIIRGPDSSYYVAGITHFYGSGDTFIAKLDQHGNIIWNKVFHTTGYGHICIGADSTLALVARTNIFSSGGQSAYVINMDGHGNVNWTTVLNGTDSGLDVVPAPNGGYCVLSYGDYVSGGYPTNLTKLNLSGAVEWSYNYTFPWINATPVSIVAHANRYTVAGNTGGDLVLMDIDTLGNYQHGYQHNSGLAPIGALTTPVLTAKNDQVYVGARLYRGYNGSISTPINDMALLHFDSSGTNVTTKLYGYSSNYLLEGFNQVGDHFIFSGREEAGLFSMFNAVLIRTDSTGNTNDCHGEFIHPFSSSLDSVTRSPVVISTSTGYNDTSFTHSSLDYNFNFNYTSPSLSLSASDVQCNGQNNGEIEVDQINEGVGPYSYSWSNGDTTALTDDLSPGTYIITVVGNDGVCEITDSASISEPPPLTLAVSITEPSCYGFGDGEAASVATGGTAPYFYSWSNGQTTPTSLGLFSGNYFVNVFDDRGCLTSQLITVNQPAQIDLAFNTSGTTCNGNNGWTQVMATGGSAGYNYTWSNGDSGAIADSLSPGFISVLVTDSNNCQITDSVEIDVVVNDIQICLITVDSSNRNTVVWAKDTSDNIQGYRIYRNIVGIYTPVGYVPQDSLSQFVDYSFGIDPGVTSYRYKISALDSCGNESAQSAHHETIHLTTSAGIGGEVNLIWDDYEGFSYSFYYILRDSNFTGNWQVIDSVPTSNFTYTDFNVPSGGAAYAILISAPSVCQATKAVGDFNSSRSNSSAQLFGGPASLDNLEFEASVFPNPFQNQLTVKINNDLIEQVQVFDMHGKLLLSQPVNANQVTLDLAHFHTGLYMVKAYTPGGVLSTVVSKTR